MVCWDVGDVVVDGDVVSGNVGIVVDWCGDAVVGTVELVVTEVVLVADNVRGGPDVSCSVVAVGFGATVVVTGTLSVGIAVVVSELKVVGLAVDVAGATVVLVGIINSVVVVSTDGSVGLSVVSSAIVVVIGISVEVDNAVVLLAFASAEVPFVNGASVVTPTPPLPVSVSSLVVIGSVGSASVVVKRSPLLSSRPANFLCTEPTSVNVNCA